jgi:hypothetical protein
MPLIAHFKFDNNTADSMNTYSSNTPTDITYTNLGKINSAAIFNGTSSMLTLANTINLSHNANWTVSVWIKTTSSATMSILSNSSGGPVVSDFRIVNGKIVYYHYNGSWQTKTGTITVNDGQWHNLIWVNFSNSKMNMYVDGILDQYMVDSTLHNMGPVNQIGKNWSTQYFNGTMDDFRIYDDSITSKISKLSMSSKLVGHWPLNGNIQNYSGYSITSSGTSSYTAGKIGQSLNCNSSSAIVFNFDPISKDRMTLAYWVRPTGIPSSDWRNVFALKDMDNTTYFNGDTRQVSNYFILHVIKDYGVSSWNSHVAITNADFISQGWFHIVLIIDGLTFKTYKNGILVGSTNITVDIAGYKNINRLDLNASGANVLNMNDVRLYNYILSDHEIAELYKAKILHYKFNSLTEEPTVNIFQPTFSVLTDASMTGSFDGNTMSGTGGTSGSLAAYFASSYRHNIDITNMTISIENPSNVTRWVVRFYNSGSTIITTAITGWTYNIYYQGHFRDNMGGVTEYTFTSLPAGVRGVGFGIFQADGISSSVSKIMIEPKLNKTQYVVTSRNNIPDMSGFKNNGTVDIITHSPTIVNDSKFGSHALYFDGTNPYILSGITNNGGLATCTISFWRKNDTSITHWLPFVGQTSSHYIMATSAGTGGFYHSNIGSSWEIFKDGVSQGVGVAATPFTDQNWHHYAIRGVSLTAWTQFKINGYQNASWNVEGYFDDIRLYASNLSNDEIRSLYEKRANLDNFGNAHFNSVIKTNTRPLLYDYTIWQDGQSGSIGPFVTYAGGTTNNKRVIDKDPWGKDVVLWKADGYSSGIYNSEISIDNTKKYRMTWWAKRVTNGDATSANMYWGLNGYGSTAGVLRADSIGTNDTNPYFWSGGLNLIPLDTWVLVVGHIYPAGTGQVGTDPESGRYTVSGRLGGITRDFVWRAETTTARMRTIMVYQSNFTVTSPIQYTVYPRMDICDGTEPTIADLLAGHDSRNYEYLRESGGLINKPLDVRDKVSYIVDIDEISGTQNSNASYEISNNGTLVINGEFSEVD